MKIFYSAAFEVRLGVDRSYAPSTLLNKFGQLQAIARWMAERDKWALSSLTSGDVIDFLRMAKSRSKGLLLSERTLSSWIHLFETMWDLRGCYPNSLRVDVALLEDELFTQVRTRVTSPWKALDDDIALQLIRDGLNWIDEFGEFILQTLEASWKRESSQVGLTTRERRTRSLHFYRDLAETDDFKRLQDALTYEGQAHKVLSVAISVTEGACIALLLLLVGFRVSELVALDAGCLTSETATDGVAMDYLYGPGAKMQGRRRRWVAGYPIRRVVEYLQRLTVRSRSQSFSKTSAILLCRSVGSPAFTPGQQASRLPGDQVQKRLEDFACNGLRKGKLQAKQFHPHMARKTFAQLAVRRDKRNLEPVSTHLGHAYREFTDGKYVGIDHHLSRLLDEQDRLELSNGLTHLLTCETLAGGAAPALAAARQEVRAFPGKKTLNKLVGDLISKGVVLAPCDWGYCVYAKVTSACRGDQHGPNELFRSPEACSGCKNFTVTPRHLAWWEERAKREQDFLKQRDLPDQTREVVARRLSKTEEILADTVWLISPGRSHA